MSMSVSRSLPSLIGIAFGGGWAVFGAFALVSPWRWPTASAAVVVMAVLLCRLQVKRGEEAGVTLRLFSRRSYRWAVLFELAGIAIVAAVLSHFNRPDLLSPAIGMVVGLHFVGLWLATRSQRYLDVCLAMCAVSACSLLVPAESVRGSPRNVVVAWSNAAILWTAAAA